MAAKLAEYRRVLPYLRPHRWTLAAIVLVGLLGTGTTLVLPLVNQGLVDRGLLGRDFDALVKFSGLMVAVTLAGFVLNAASSYLYVRVSAAALFAMRRDVYAHLQAISPRRHAQLKLGDLVSRLTNDVAEVQRVSSDALLAALSNVIFLAGASVLMLRISPWLTLVSILPLPLTISLTRRAQGKVASHVATMRQRSASIGSFLVESLTGLRLTVTANQQERERSRFRELNDSFVRALLGMQATNYAASSIPATATAVATAIVFLAGGKEVLDGRISLGMLIAFLAYHGRLLAPVQNLLSLYGNLITGAVSLERVAELEAIPVDVQQSPTARALPRIEGRIALHAVSYSTPRGEVLRDIHLTVAPGETVAIVGPSGGGKSTLADLLTRLADPTLGAVTLDDQDLRTLPLTQIREAVVCVEQSPILFQTTIEENIRYARPHATGEEVQQAATAAGLALPLATEVGHRGESLSAGERQRVALARALLRQPKVLILDEPTAALDRGSRDSLLATLRTLQAGRTMLLITHDPHVAALAARVYRLEGRSLEAECPSA